MAGWWWAGLTLVALLLLLLGLSALGARRWALRAQALASRLDAAQGDALAAPSARFDARQLADLPAPVQRYFRAVLKDGQPLIAAATVELAGQINLSATGEQWKPFRSRQRIVTQRPGFVWDARVAMAPGLPVRVLDSYVDGRGLLHAALLGLFTVAQEQGDGEIARGECMRYFAEAAWYPTALLPGPRLRWAAVDDRSALATLTDGAITLTLLFRFNDAGLIESFRAEARGATQAGQALMLPWEGCWSDYRSYGDLRVPFKGEVAWMRPEGRKTYFRGSVTALHYAFMA